MDRSFIVHGSRANNQLSGSKYTACFMPMAICMPSNTWHQPIVLLCGVRSPLSAPKSKSLPLGSNTGTQHGFKTGQLFQSQPSIHRIDQVVGLLLLNLTEHSLDFQPFGG